MKKSNIKNLEQQKRFLKFICGETLKAKKELNKSNYPMSALTESCVNLLKGNIPIDEQSFEKLKIYKKLIRKISDDKYPLDKKKRIIEQKGGFLNILIPSLISGIASIIGSNVQK
jgi:hypothetical protein